MTSDAKQCIVPHPELGQCNLEACGAYCYKTYTNGSGHCAQEQSELISLEIKSASFQLLQVSPVEWLKFVEDAVHNGFHAVAVK
ncbi:hypothetical protein P8452_55193 [Trifolium repens]|nr:hypothetical protein P8452_55193 [Trifolium repens]